MANWDSGSLNATEALGSETATNNGAEIGAGFNGSAGALSVLPKQGVKFSTKDNIDLSRSSIESNFKLKYPLSGIDTTSFNFSNSGQIALDGTVMYVADTGGNRIVRMNWNGTSWDSWDAFGQFGAGVGQFNKPTSIAFDPTNDVAYIGDSGNCRVVRIHWNGVSWDSWSNYGYCGADQEQFNTNAYTTFSSFTLDTSDPVNPTLILGDYGRIIRMTWDNTNSEWGNWIEFTSDNDHVLQNIKSVAWDPSSSTLYILNGVTVDGAPVYYIYPAHWNNSTWDLWSEPVQFGNANFIKSAELSIDPTGNILYASDPVSVYKFDISTATTPTLGDGYTFTSFDGGDNPFSDIRGMAYDAANSAMYLLDVGNSNPIIRALSTGATDWGTYSKNGGTQSIATSFTPVDVAYDSINSVLFVAETSRILALHMTNGMIDKWYSYSSPGTTSITYDPGSSTLFAMNTVQYSSESKIKSIHWNNPEYKFDAESSYGFGAEYMFVSEPSFIFDSDSQSIYLTTSGYYNSGWTLVANSLSKLKWNVDTGVFSNLETVPGISTGALGSIASSNSASRNLYIQYTTSDKSYIKKMNWTNSSTALSAYTTVANYEIIDYATMVGSGGSPINLTDIVYSISDNVLYGIDPANYHVVRSAFDVDHYNEPEVYGQRGSIDDYGTSRTKEGVFGALKGISINQTSKDIYIGDSGCRRAVKVKWDTSAFTGWATFADPFHYVMTTTGQYPLRIRFNVATSRLEFFLSYGSKEVFMQSDILSLSADVWYMLRVKYDSSTGQYSLIVYNYTGNDYATSPVAYKSKEATTVGSWVAPTNLGANFYLGMDTNPNFDQRSLGGFLDNFTIESLAPPPAPATLTVNPVSYSGTKDFTFTWTAGGGAYANDIQGYEYQINDDGFVNNAMNLTYTLNNTNNPDTDLEEGPNVFTVRARGKNGNYSPVKTVNFYFSQETASAPRNLVMAPETAVGTPSDDNNFTATYTAPEVTGGEPGDIVYYYSVDERPVSTSNTKVTIPGQTTIEGIKATVQADVGPSIFYILSKGKNNLINWNACGPDPSDPTNKTKVKTPAYCAVALMYVNTMAPGFPTAVAVKDTSNKDKSVWEAVVRWDKPSQEGTGDLTYEICRSENGGDWGSCNTTTQTYFYQTGLSNTIDYSFRVRAQDDAKSYSDHSAATEPIKLTGKFTNAAVYIEHSMSIAPKSTTATIKWSTQDSELKNVHKANSYIEYGKTKDTIGKESGGFEAGEQAYVDDHEITITGLEPDKTKYYFRLVWYDEDGNKGTYEELDETKAFATTFETGMRPTVTDVQATNRTLNSADISYKTSVDATTEISYGLDRNSLDYTCTFSTNGYGTDHVISLPCPKQFASANSPVTLNHTSTYYFKIKGHGTDNEPLDIGSVYDFQTLTMPKIVGAVTMDQDKDAPTTTYRFAWKTNIKTSSVVNFTNNKGRKESKTIPEMTIDHDVTVPSLADESIYTFEIGGTDENWINVEAPFTSEVTTPKDSRPPKVSNMTVEVKSSGFGATQKAQLVVSWQTDEPSTSQVEYDLGISGGSYANKSKEDAALSTSHVVILAELEPSKIYHLRAVSKDGSGNGGYSEDTTTITGKMQNSVLDIIINSLEKSLGWLFGIFGSN